MGTVESDLGPGAEGPRTSTLLDHTGRNLSTDPAPVAPPPSRAAVANLRESEQANAVRYRVAGPGAQAPGHVESHFLKANSPDGVRALWVKHTLLVPSRAGDTPVAELWAIAFDQRGRRKLAQKTTYPLRAARLAEVPFSFGLPDAELSHGAARGTVGQGAESLSWDLHFASDQAPFLPFRYPRMYSGAFPRSKSLTPFPDTRVYGSFSAWGERWELDGWRGAQGHNWGKSHAHAYGWVHCNALSPAPGAQPLEDTWLEALSGRVRLGPVVTPFLSVAGIKHQGRLFRFDAARAIVSRKVAVQARPRAHERRIDTGSFGFELRQDGATLVASFHAEHDQFAGLSYRDPDGQVLACLNSKLARGQLTLSYEGRSTTLYTDQAALELGIRSTDHGVVLLT
ncbi:MAG: hypothetical protein RLZZ450_7696 [Pseudomonadota bacterium]|jgi:hypothetical protein